MGVTKSVWKEACGEVLEYFQWAREQEGLVGKVAIDTAVGMLLAGTGDLAALHEFVFGKHEGRGWGQCGV